jgi:asparagine synthase (glutamine-hydrolysing)
MADVVYHTETAIRESYDVAAYLLSGLVQSTSVKAVLTGQGADEFFNGYVGYFSDSFRLMQKNKMTREECEINERLWGDPYFRYERNHNEIGEFHKSLYSFDALDIWESFSVLNKSPIDLQKVKGLKSQRRRSYIDSKLRLADHLLGDHGDRMFFAHSVEGRHPFLDINLINFVIDMPEKYKLRGANEKYILKKAAEGIVPEPVIKRKKFPFSTPGMSYMLKQKNNPGEKYLSEEIIKEQGIFNAETVRKLKNQYVREDFNLAGAYEIDYLQIIMTVTMLCNQFNLKI